MIYASCETVSQHAVNGLALVVIGNQLEACFQEIFQGES